MVFGNRCPLAKDSPDFICNEEVVLDFTPEANTSDINFSSVDLRSDRDALHSANDK